MDELLKLIGELPLPALIVFAGVVGLIFGVRYLGLWQGQNMPAKASAAAAQVAAVIVDPTALNAAAGSVDGLTVAVTEATVTARQHVKATAQLADEVKDLREAVGRLGDEVIRAAARVK